MLLYPLAYFLYLSMGVEVTLPRKRDCPLAYSTAQINHGAYMKQGETEFIMPIGKCTGQQSGFGVGIWHPELDCRLIQSVTG
jgi:hypothetical protein